MKKQSKVITSVVLSIAALLVVAALIIGSRQQKQQETTASSTPVVSEKQKADPISNTTPDTRPAPEVKAETGYITLADFNSDTKKYDNSKKIYFFHASWCPICQSIDKDIASDTSKIPDGTVIIKTDFDSSTSLRQKYGVTLQYTFVQFTSDGTLQKKWSATSYDKVLAGILNE